MQKINYPPPILKQFNLKHLSFNGQIKQVQRDLNIPWLAPMDHLDHRMWIEENEANFLWK